MSDQRYDLIHRAATRKLRSYYFQDGVRVDLLNKTIAAEDIDPVDDYTGDNVYPNCDPKHGPGVWVEVYLFLSDEEISDAGDNTP